MADHSEFSDPVDSSQLSRALAAAELCYGRGMSQKQAASVLNTSPASLSRLLKLAKQTGLVQITFHRPINLQLSEALQDQLPTLRKVVVGGTSRRDVANMAAAWYQERDRTGQVAVLDGGRTVADFVEALQYEPFRNIQPLPIVADPPTYEQAASENAVKMATKLSTSRLYRLPQFRGPYLNKAIDEVQQAARQAECVILSVGPFQREFTALEFTQHLGLDPAEIRSRYPSVAAAIGYLGIDEHGSHISLREVDERLIRALSYNELRSLSRRLDVDVVLLADSREKVIALEAALHAQICNILFIDEGLAECLLRRFSDA